MAERQYITATKPSVKTYSDGYIARVESYLGYTTLLWPHQIEAFEAHGLYAEWDALQRLRRDPSPQPLER